MVFAGLSLAKYIQQSPSLLRVIKPVANAYANATGYRQVGLKYDDLIVEENPRVQKALKRLTERESYDRAYRLKQASHLSVLHRELPKDQWTPVGEDKRYLTPLIDEIAAEESERAAWDTASVEKK
ncbi:14 kDa subunit of cytochrome bd ubiquinol oxidase [Violaceomyces palustris]|uniref:14 kDa subunit of cytochrome bd ubiquinol oxidase n=1 Tax=Violaceomyces palustris TaxID=1673888 RepID=A0ACD0NMR2_9BASI|nr:14 kDa subunit of cytochrome bd ubiquinol oxidase [Violaceomyces palustris]